MTNHELLLAISNMLDPIKKDMSEMKGDIRELKCDVRELKIRMKKVEMTQENEILPRLDNIESCYLSTYDRYRDSTEEHETMKQDCYSNPVFPSVS